MLDRAFGFIILILLIPVLLIISILIYVLYGSPVLYKDKRCGYKFKAFNLYKFRTMKNIDGASITIENDKRITFLGHILRKIRFDEFPQLINVIKGEMVMVGPRPEALGIVKAHRESFKYLYHCKPGVTDVVSIIFKNENIVFSIKDKKDYIEKILPIKAKLIKDNCKALSVWKQICILLLTLFSFINYKKSLHIINEFFLFCEDRELRERLNYLLTKDFSNDS